MVGPDAERTGLVRHASRLLVAAARIRVPFIGVILRRAYGLGAQAMLAGSTHSPLMTVAWPGATMGAMGLEGAVRLSTRAELEAIADDDEREERVRLLTEMLRANSTGLNAARYFEIDDVIDPAETRSLIAQLVDAAAHGGRSPGAAASSIRGRCRGGSDRQGG